MFGRAKGILTVALGVLTASAMSLVAGEKIQFSKPSGGGTANTAPTKDSPTKSSPNLFDNFKNGGVDAFNFTPAAPQAPAPERGSKEDHWIFARPGDGPTIEEVLEIEDKSSSKQSSDRFQNSISKYVEAAEAAAAAQQNSELPSNEFESPFSDLANDRDALGWQQPGTLSNRDTLYNDQSSAVSDYFKELRSPERERIEDMNLARRNEFQQIFQTRTALPGVNGLDKPLNPLDARRQETTANPAATAPGDLLSRTSPTSFSDPSTGTYEPLTATRSSVLDGANSRVFGRESSDSLNTRAEPLRATPQPAVLPFPARPGSLLQRP